MELIKKIFSAMATVPILPFVVVFFGFLAFGRDKKKAVRMAMDISSIFFIVNVAALFNGLLGNGFGLYGILLVMLIGAGLLGNGYYRKKQEIPWKVILRIVWRITFFITALLSIVLFLIHILRLAFTV